MTQADPKRGERPDPDALLALIKSDERGKLKLFLGAAPGVGKTFAMLSGAKVAARSRASRCCRSAMSSIAAA
jgi:two-component system sensor histidine kinase KdpD